MANKNKGVTIIMLVITIIVLILLALFAVYYSTDIAPEARIASAYNSLKEIRTACTEAKSRIEIYPEQYDEYDFFGKSIRDTLSESEQNELAQKCGLTSKDDFSDSTYVISGEDDDEIKRRIQNLELSNINREFVCDIGNNNFYVYGGVKRKTGETFYEYKDIAAMYDILTETKN